MCVEGLEAPSALGPQVLAASTGTCKGLRRVATAVFVRGSPDSVWGRPPATTFMPDMCGRTAYVQVPGQVRRPEQPARACGLPAPEQHLVGHWPLQQGGGTRPARASAHHKVCGSLQPAPGEWGLGKVGIALMWWHAQCWPGVESTSLVAAAVALALSRAGRCYSAVNLAYELGLS